MIRERKKIKQKTDNELIELIKMGKKMAYSELFDRYYSLVLGVCLKYLRNKTNAEDLAMEIFAGLEDKIKHHEIQYFKSWLYRLSCNAALMTLRKKKNYTVELIDEIQEGNESEIDEKIKIEEDLNIMELALNDLKPEQKTCLSLFYLESVSYEGIAKKMNWNLKQVKSYLQNGKRNLAIQIKKRKDEEHR